MKKLLMLSSGVLLSSCLLFCSSSFAESDPKDDCPNPTKITTWAPSVCVCFKGDGSVGEVVGNYGYSSQDCSKRLCKTRGYKSGEVYSGGANCGRAQSMDSGNYTDLENLVPDPAACLPACEDGGVVASTETLTGSCKVTKERKCSEKKLQAEETF